MSTLGEYLVNSTLPVNHRNPGVLSKNNLTTLLVNIAKNDPDKYPKVVTDLKRLGDEMATLEGVSVGLDDVAPDYKNRDALLKPYLERYHAAKPSARESILLEAQDAVLAATKSHVGTLGDMVRSGGRGNAGQLMKIVSAPVLARDEKDQVTPWFLHRSYAEGLTPADAWVAGNEARINAIKTHTAVVEPGDLAKILVNNMSDKLITIPDCGTHNGIPVQGDDPMVIDRYLARGVGKFPIGTLITPGISHDLRKEDVIVRSPMTCEAPHGICQKCQGLDVTGRPHLLGVNVGMRAAQSMAEPLTQFALSVKHGGRIKGGKDDKEPTGIKGVRQILEIPESFLHQATLAEHAGEVTKTEVAPQGGHYVFVNDTKHYIPPNLEVLAVKGQKVTPGDALSDGVPRPDEVVHYKGLGEGRQYLADLMHGVYKRAGMNVDHRHLEILARSVLNHVRVVDTGADGEDSADEGFIRGEIINQNRLNAALAKDRKMVPIADALGERLGANVLHLTAGTVVTPREHDMLARHGVKDVDIATRGPRVEPFMRSASRNPLLNPDFLSRLAHRYLKDTLIAGAHKGDTGDTHSYHPAGAYAAGTEFGQGIGGRY